MKNLTNQTEKLIGTTTHGQMDYRASLKYAIETIAKYLKTDFGQLYAKQFLTDQDLTNWKRRCWVKVKGLHPGDILDGYEMLVGQKPLHLPTIPELANAAVLCQKTRETQEKNQAEAERIALIPPKPEISESVARKNLKKIRELLGGAFDGMEKPETGAEKAARLVRLEEKRLAHEALLDKDFPLRGKDIVPPPVHECHVGWCRNPGTVSNAITGNGNYYCNEHFSRQGAKLMDNKIELTKEEKTQLAICLAIDALDNGNLRKSKLFMEELIRELGGETQAVDDELAKILASPEESSGSFHAD